MVRENAVARKSSELLTKNSITLTINGRRFKFSVGDGIGDVSPAETLTETLRKRLQMTGSKESCGAGACGCCAVIVNGDAVAACMALTVELDGKNITTIEGLEDAKKGLDPIQQAFIDEYAFQKGGSPARRMLNAAASPACISTAHPGGTDLSILVGDSTIVCK